MTLLYAVYLTITGLLFLIIFPYFLIYTLVTGRCADHLLERLGGISQKARKSISGRPRIWIHAVSLGEVKVAKPIIHVLKRDLPGCALIVSTTTAHGRKSARATFGPDIPVIYAPVDVRFCVHRALRTIRPDVMVFLETEIWPAWLYEARRMGIRTALINGRISIRSIDGYLRLRPFMKQVLRHIDAFSMILHQDARRIMAIGAPPGRVLVNGNAKYDGLAAQKDAQTAPDMRRLLNLRPKDRVLVAGSTRQGEEEILLKAYKDVLKRFSDTLLMIAPRHVERAVGICDQVRRYNLTCRLRTQIHIQDAPRTEQVVVMDTFGELFNLYSVATVVFCGASLVPLGGQNPLEPAAWGKAVLYGPSMEDFLDATEILRAADAAVCVSDARELSRTVIRLLSDPEALTAMGAHARDAVHKHQGAAAQQANVIQTLATPHPKRERH